MVNPNKPIVNHNKMVNHCKTMVQPWQTPGKAW